MELPKSIGEPAIRALMGIGIYRLEDAQSLSDKELTALHGFGPKALRLLRSVRADDGQAEKQESRKSPERRGSRDEAMEKG